MPDVLTILSHSTNDLSKLWKLDGSIKAYDSPKQFTLRSVQIDDMECLSKLLTKLEKKPKTCLIRGKYLGDEINAERSKDEYESGKVMRRKELFCDQPLHTLLVEVDGFPVDPNQTPQEQVEQYIATLPSTFQGVSYHAQLSNSSGHPKYDGKLKAHIWFWLAEPLTSAQLRAWANIVKISYLDSAVLDTIQVHYTSAPRFEDGVGDPVAVRSWFAQGWAGDEVVGLDIGEAIAATEKLSVKDRGAVGEVEDKVANALVEGGKAKEGSTWDRLFIDCPFAAAHTDGKTGATDTCYLPAGFNGYSEGRWKCLHNACSNRKGDEFAVAMGVAAEAMGFDEVAEAPKLRVGANGKPLGQTILAPSLQGLAIPARSWIVKDWLLPECVTALYGDGGVGKSLLAMQLATCVAVGRPFMGLETVRMPTFGFYCEDSEAELQRRQADINARMGLDFSDLEGVAWQSRVGGNNLLMDFIKEGTGKATEAFGALKAAVMSAEVRAKVIVVDTAADTFGGNENARPQVRQFINMLSGLAIEVGGSVLLCAHPSAAGLARDDGTGGSTAWNNTVRARWYLKRPRGEDGKELMDSDNSDLRELAKKKSNYSRVGDGLMLRWREGAFSLVEAMGAALDETERDAREVEDDRVFMDLLGALTLQGRAVSDKGRSGTYAPRVMTGMPLGRGVGVRRLAEAMERLFNRGVIEFGVFKIGKNRHKVMGVTRVKFGA